MENFIYSNPTKLNFGVDCSQNIGKIVSIYGRKALIIYGKESIKKNGLYDNIINQLKEYNIEHVEYSGIKSNPLITDVDAATEIGKKNSVEVILAVGGGSVIDSAKIISLSILENCKAWEIVTGTIKPKASIPLIAVLTIAATGTEMNPFAVVQNQDTKEKIGYGNNLIYPKESILDPTNTLSVSKKQTAYGIVDTMAHCFEAWFGQGDAPLTDRFTSSIIKETMNFGLDLLNELDNLELRKRMMFASCMALNGLTSLGRKSGDWGVHGIGHTISALYDIPHGATLSIVYPAWLKNFETRHAERIEKLGYRLFKTENTKDAIYKIENFFKLIGAPVRLQDVGIYEDKKEEIIALLKKNNVNGYNIKLKTEDYIKIVDAMFN